MRIEFPVQIKTNKSGFDFLVKVYSTTRDISFNTIILDFNNCIWFDANLCAMLGAITHHITQNINNIELVNLNHAIKAIFNKNGFLSHFGGEVTGDIYNTTIKYKRYTSNEQTLFKKYLDDELLSMEDFPQMSEHLKKKINQSIFEIFENAVTHGQSEYVFSCGQYYPRNNPPRLDFTIVDIGQTIKKNVNKYLHKNYSGAETIKWAVDENNTTKKGNTPGGLGLKLIREFTKLNTGQMHIVSSDGFWQQTDKNTILAQNFANSFSGTVVNIEVSFNDNGYYYTNEEIELTEYDIF